MLTSNGVLMFQLPEPIESPLHQFVHAPVEQPWVKRALPAMVVRLYRLAKYAYIKSTAGPEMRMFGLPFEVVERIIHTSGGFLLACRADASHGVAGVAGFEYWVGKDDRCPSL